MDDFQTLERPVIMMKFYATLLLALVFSVCATAQQTSVLFLGNSYTASSLPTAFYNLALSGGDTVYYESNTPGGYTLEGHSANATSLGKIASRNWDFVVMQEQSQRPSFSDGQVAQEVYPYAEILVDSIRSNYECSEPVFYMTWGRENGDQSNCANFPPICTYQGMQERLRNAYLEMTFDNEATVAPCGAAWQQMALVNSSFWAGLYTGDGSHPSAWGTYLNACVFYTTIFRKSPVGLDYYSSIGQADATTLQQLAEDIVLDSLSTWNIGHADVIADAANDGSQGLTINFTSNSSNAINHHWDFGDGNTSIEETPSHSYTDYGTYQVQYIASSECDADSLTFEISTSPNSVEDNILDQIRVIQQNEYLRVENPLTDAVQLDVLDLTGRTILTKSINGAALADVMLNSKAQVYLLRLSTENITSTRKVFVN